MKATHILALSFITAAIALPVASARPAYYMAAIEQLKLADKDGKPAVTCQFCHQSPNGGAPWNKFGDSVRAEFLGNSNRNINNALYAVLKANKDADEDGYNDVLEVIAKTLPGDAKSKPEKSVAALEAELKDMGGVDSFKPKAK